ncbi:Hypothetical predicted protein [Lynx pardinus]|nr:Hypothetical predicted protein [Lynx pardinus]
MVPVSRSREGPENMVRIALQLDDGSRLQDTFCSGQTLWELLNHFAQTRECLEQLSEASPVCVYMRDEVTGRASLQSTTLKSLGLTGGSAIIRFAMKRRNQEPGVSRTKTPGSPAPSLSADQATGGPLLPLNSVGLSQGDVSHQDEVGTSGASRVDAPAKQISKEPAPAPFVPFSGGGQRLGGSSGSARSLTSPSAKPPKSFSSPGGPSKPKKSRPGQEPGSEPEPVRSPRPRPAGRRARGRLSQEAVVRVLFGLKSVAPRARFRCSVWWVWTNSCPWDRVTAGRAHLPGGFSVRVRASDAPALRASEPSSRTLCLGPGPWLVPPRRRLWRW